MATEIERIENLEGKYSDLHTVVNVLANKVDNLANEMQDFKNEMRDRDNRRADEIAEIRNDIKEIYKTTDAKIDSINKSIASMQNQNIFVIIGVIAIAVAVFLK